MATNMNAIQDYYESEVIGANDSTKDRYWADYGGIYNSVNHAVKTLPAKSYNVVRANDGKIYLQGVVLGADNLLVTPKSQATELIDEICQFWNNAKIFHKHGFLHRRGFLLHGAPGNGKTALVNILIRKVTAADGIALIFSPSTCEYAVQVLQMVRKVEAKRPMICVFEDIDKMLDRQTESLLSLLDGEDAADHVINIATTNYLDLLPARIKGRPRRFDTVLEIGPPSAEMRAHYLKKKLNIQDGKKLAKYLEASKGFSFAGLADLVISVECLKQPFAKAVARLRKMLCLNLEEEASDAGADTPEADLAALATASAAKEDS